MKKYKLITLLISIIIILFTLLSGCNKVKDAVQSVAANTQSAKDYVIATSTFIDIFTKVDDIQQQNLLKINKANIPDSCPTIIESSITFPKTYRIIFDTVNSCSSQNITYKGTILLSLT